MYRVSQHDHDFLLWRSPYSIIFRYESLAIYHISERLIASQQKRGQGRTVLTISNSWVIGSGGAATIYLNAIACARLEQHRRVVQRGGSLSRLLIDLVSRTAEKTPYYR